MRSTAPWWVYDLLDNRRHKLTNWITGGLGSGKSYGAALWHLSRCRTNAKSKVSWHVDLTHAKAEAISIPAFVEVLATHFGQYEGKDFKVVAKKPAEIQLKQTGQVIRFHSIKKWREMVGENISHWSATEVGYYPSRDWWGMCMKRLRCPRAACLQGLGEGTPEGTNWWSEVADFEGYSEKYNAQRTILWTSDNPYLSPDYVDTIVSAHGHDPQRLESYLYGRFVPFTHGTAYWEFMHSRNVKLDFTASPYLPLIIGWDFNKSPLSWVALQRQPVETRFGGRKFRFTAVAEASGEARGLLDACAEIIARFPVDEWGSTQLDIHGDPAGFAGSHKTPSCDFDVILQYLRPYYANVRICAARSAPKVRARLERVNGLLAYEQLVIAPSCRNTIKSLTLTELKPGTFEIQKPGGEWWTHFADALGYPLFEITKDEDLENPGAAKVRGLNKQI